MLRSTHKPSAAATAPLAPGWTEHKAPSGHTYYYNAATKQSTYQKPVAITAPPPVAAPLNPSQSFLQYQNVTLGPQPGAPFGPQATGVPFNAIPHSGPNMHQSRQNQPQRPKPQPTDKPKSRRPIPSQENWYLIETKLQRRFVYNSAKNESYWRIPEKLKQPILEMDQARIREKAETWAREQEAQKGGNGENEGPAQRPGMAPAVQEARERLDVPEGEDSDEYEEVEVTDDEGAGEMEQEAKRQRLEMERPEEVEEPVEFTEEDIAYQLAALGQDHGLEPDEYGAEEYAGEEYDEGVEFSQEDAVALFKDLLNDSGISPFMDWDRVVEEGKLVDDGRYTSLTTMKRRKEVWDEWTVERIAKIKEQRAREAKRDPRIPFLAYLQRNANPKLYWPEFRRKFRKDAEMKAPELTDREREKMYREHVARLKLPQSTLKSDFLNLLKAQPLKDLNNKTTVHTLPQRLLSDIKFYSLEEQARDALVEQYISTLPPPSEVVGEEESEEVKKERSERERREKALAERERRVAEEKRKQERNLAVGKGRLREEEEMIERAMDVGKGGLRGQLMEMDVDPKDGGKDE